MLSVASRRAATTTVLSSSSRAASSTVAATTVSNDIPSYVTSAPEVQISKLDNGVTVATLFNAE